MSAVITFDKVSKYFSDGLIPQKKSALENISFSVQKGSTLAYLGPNGAGKTTSIKLLLGFLFPDKGQISLFESDPSRPEIRQKVGFVSDYPYFYEYLTAAEYLAFCGRLNGLNDDELAEAVPKNLERVRLPDAGNLKLRKLSRGMAQRLNFAQALLHDPDLIILDEPFSGLDPFGRMDLRNIILDLKSREKTIFFSSHILEDAEILADEIIFLNKGFLIHQGSKNQTYEHLEKSYHLHISGNKDHLKKLAKKYHDTSEIKEDILLLKIGQSELNNVINLINTFKLSILELEKNTPKLEDAFLKKFSEYE